MAAFDLIAVRIFDVHRVQEELKVFTDICQDHVGKAGFQVRHVGDGLVSSSSATPASTSTLSTISENCDEESLYQVEDQRQPMLNEKKLQNKE